MNRLLITTIVLLASVVSTYAQIPEGQLQVHFIDVGTGDCIWIHTGDDGIDGNGRMEGYNIIIDGGDWGRFGRANGYAAASEYLDQNGRLPFGSTIDWMILTHPHSDHNGGLYGFLQDYEVRNILDPGHDKTNDEGEPDRLRSGSAYGRFFLAAATEVFGNGQLADFVWGIPDNFTLDWGSELDVDILWSSREIVGNDLNNVSIVLRLAFTADGNDISFLFAGDAEHFVENELVNTLGNGLRTTVLKAGHHGSNSSTSEAFLREVRPAHVIISAGNHSFSGTMLPRQETFTRIQTVSNDLGLNTQVWRTDRGDKTPTVIPVGNETGDDTILATTNGQTLNIRYVGAGSGATGTDPSRCQAITQSGTQCKRRASAGTVYCWQHRH
jgi:beta-lactamase superfamily II metal-dependent hydrolase